MLPVNGVSGLDGLPRRLIHLNLLIALDGGQGLHDSAWPPNFDAVGHSAVSHPKMNARVAGGEVAAGGGGRNPLRPLRRGQLDHGADAVAIALVPGQVEGDPMVLSNSPVEQNMRRAAVGA